MAEFLMDFVLLFSCVNDRNEMPPYFVFRSVCTNFDLWSKLGFTSGIETKTSCFVSYSARFALTLTFGRTCSVRKTSNKICVFTH